MDLVSSFHEFSL